MASGRNCEFVLHNNFSLEGRQESSSVKFNLLTSNYNCLLHSALAEFVVKYGNI